MRDNKTTGTDGGPETARPGPCANMGGAMPVIDSVTFAPAAWDVPGPVDVVAVLDDGSTVTLFRYFPDELHFSANDFVGRTVDEARALRHRRDVDWLRS